MTTQHIPILNQLLIFFKKHLIRGSEWKYCNNYTVDILNVQTFEMFSPEVMDKYRTVEIYF